MDFFTSDLHFYHEGVMSFDERPWKSVEEMDAALVERWNAVVGPKDTVYILGDLMWSAKREQALAILRALHGHLILVRGNHDGRWLHGDDIKRRFMRIEDYLDIRLRRPDGTRIYLAMSHYPIHFYNHAHHGGVMLYGHVHTGREFHEVERVRRELVERGVPCVMYPVFCGLYDWAPATFEQLVERAKQPLPPITGQDGPGHAKDDSQASSKAADPNADDTASRIDDLE